MPKLAGKVAWVTGAGSGIGEAAAFALAGEGATLVLTGRRREPLEDVARRLGNSGAEAHVQPADLTDSAQVQLVGDFIRDKLGRLDILVNNAGVNILDRHWDKLTPEGIDTLDEGQCHGGAVLRHRCSAVHARAAGRGDDPHVLDGGAVHRWVSGPIYGTAKHGVVAMSHTINMEECVNGIRSCVFLPGEVATPILDKRPNPVGPEERARMVQSEDCGDLIRYIACLPRHLVMSEVMLGPTHNRSYIANLQRKL